MVEQIERMGLSVKQIAAGNELTMVLTHQGDLYYQGYNEINNSTEIQTQKQQEVVIQRMQMQRD